jgi:hypothetical protein
MDIMDISSKDTAMVELELDTVMAELDIPDPIKKNTDQITSPRNDEDSSLNDEAPPPQFRPLK